METPKIPANEAERLAKLRAYQILDTLPEAEYDSITRLASFICQTPISLVSLIDENRQWFKSHHGLDATETPRDVAFCAHAINQPDRVFVVDDPTKDHRFADNPLVTGYPEVKFYAGAPLVTADGYALGTLCVIDHQARHLNESQLEALKTLAFEVVSQLELRWKIREMEQVQAQLQEQKNELERFAHQVSHDLKSPLRAMGMLAELVREESAAALSDDSRDALEKLQDKAEHAFKLVNGILEHAVAGQAQCKPEAMQLEPFIQSVVDFCSPGKGTHIVFDLQVFQWNSDPVLLHQILQNLINNAIKYNDKSECLITIRTTLREAQLCIEVEDNGPGIPEAFRERIFLMFQTLHGVDKFGQKGTGIGLSTVKRLTQALGGSIAVDSTPGEGSVFRVLLPEILSSPQ